jgi:hypothetical protein
MQVGLQFVLPFKQIDTTLPVSVDINEQVPLLLQLLLQL